MKHYGTIEISRPRTGVGGGVSLDLTNETSSRWGVRVSTGNSLGLDYHNGTSWTNLFGLTTSGSLALSQGLMFPGTQVPSADANTLDDYEEGTWSPIIGGSSGQSGQSYTYSLGRYVKIGRQVITGGYVQLSAAGTISGAYATLGGLPFTVGALSNDYSTPQIGYFFGWSGQSFYQIGGYIVPDTNMSYLSFVSSPGTQMTTMAPANVSNASGFIFSLNYFAAN